MPRINLEACPISSDTLSEAEFEQTRLVIVGNMVYPVIGEEAWNGFIQHITSCPYTRSREEYLVLTIADLADNNLKNQLHAWLFDEDLEDEMAPKTPKALVELLTNKEGGFQQSLTARSFHPNVQNVQIAIDAVAAFNGALTNEEYNSLPHDMREVIAGHCRHTRNLIETYNLSFNQIQALTAPSFEFLCNYSDALRYLINDETQITLVQLLELEPLVRNEIIRNYTYVVELKSNHGIGLADLLTLGLEQDKICKISTMIELYGATFTQLQELATDNRLQELLDVSNSRSPVWEKIRSGAMTFEKLATLELEDMRAVILDPESAASQQILNPSSSRSGPGMF